VDVSKPVMPKAMWKPPALIPEPLSCVRYLTVPEALAPAHPGVFPPHPVFDLSAMPAHVACEHTSSRPVRIMYDGPRQTWKLTTRLD